MSKSCVFQNPLEQFSIFSIKSCFTGNYVNVLIIHLFLIMMLFYFLNCSVLLSSALQFFIFKLFELIKDIYLKNTSFKISSYLPIFFYMFLVMLINNLMGLIPYSYSITSSLMFNFYIVFMMFVMINLVGVMYHKWNFLNIFMPKGLPLSFTWFLIFFETVSYFASIFSLTIRLFANMLSGHMLQHMLISFSFKIFLIPSFLSFFFILPWAIAFLVTCLEIAICFLQAYVFMTLLLMYFGNTVNLH